MYKEYIQGEHGGQFVGIRIAVSVNHQVRQRYFSFKRPVMPHGAEKLIDIDDGDTSVLTCIRRYALSLHDTWINDKNKCSRTRSQSKTQKSQLITRNSTEIRGVTYGWYQCGTRLVARVNASFTDCNGKRGQHQIRVDNLSSIKRNWTIIIKIMSLNKGYESPPADWIAMCPTVSDFYDRLPIAQLELGINKHITFTDDNDMEREGSHTALSTLVTQLELTNNQLHAKMSELADTISSMKKAQHATNNKM